MGKWIDWIVGKMACVYGWAIIVPYHVIGIVTDWVENDGNKNAKKNTETWETVIDGYKEAGAKFRRMMEVLPAHVASIAPLQRVFAKRRDLEKDPLRPDHCTRDASILTG